MTDNWKPYLCNVNGKLASILVNLGLRDSVPISSKPWLLWVWVYFQSPRPDGLSDGKEAPTLYKIEDALKPRLDQACQALLSGRITTEGRREFYFYGDTKAGFRKAVADALTGFDGYKFDLGEQEDSFMEPIPERPVSVVGRFGAHRQYGFVGCAGKEGRCSHDPQRGPTLGVIPHRTISRFVSRSRTRSWLRHRRRNRIRRRISVRYVCHPYPVH
jgi:hypothetical protein